MCMLYGFHLSSSKPCPNYMQIVWLSCEIFLYKLQGKLDKTILNKI